VFRDRLYLQTITFDDLATTQERLVAVDVERGRVVWERRVSQYLSDVPQHRSAWASPAVDPTTGNVFMFTVSAELLAFAPDGTRLWERSLPEEYGAITTHGGRTTSPIIEGDLVILNTLIQNWGPDLGRPGNRYFAFDKRTGQTVWVSSPQARHYDTNYSTPIVADVNGTRLMMVGGTDGVFHALQVGTGRPQWSLEASKRAILNSVLFRDNTLYISHGEENIDTTEMGLVAAIDPTGSGTLTGGVIKWATRGFLPTYSSPVMDRDRLYAVDNSAILGAFDLSTGKQLWTRGLGTLQKGSPVLADGKLYVGTENGKFYILRPSATGVDVLDEDQVGSATNPEPILASPAVADGRIYVVSYEPVTKTPGSSGHLYAIGRRVAPAGGAGPRSAGGARGAAAPAMQAARATGAVAQVQVFPYEVLLQPGAVQAFSLKLYDAKGTFLRTEPADQATWTLDGLSGTVARGSYTAAPSGGSAGFVRAAVGGVTGQARVRVVPPLPWTFDFNAEKAPIAWWVTNLKTSMAQLDGNGVLVRPRDDTVGRRAKIFLGPADLSDLTIESDVRGTESRRQRGDIGLINQRYVLALFGNAQKLEIHPWVAADEMTVRVPFAWALNTWYRMKLRVETRADGAALVRGKVWAKDAAEPAAWTIEKVDRIGHRRGAPGLYGDGYSDMMFDNVRVYRNQ
jgi:outer membrane protein assembly factor BamB